jgi:hypothetical protein
MTIDFKIDVIRFWCPQAEADTFLGERSAEDHLRIMLQGKLSSWRLLTRLSRKQIEARNPFAALRFHRRGVPLLCRLIRLDVAGIRLMVLKARSTL